MGWTIGAGLALMLLLLVAFANFMLIVAQVVRDQTNAKFLLLAFALLGSGQTLLFCVVVRTGFLSAPTFEIMWLISMCIVITSLIVVLTYGGASRCEDRL